MTSHLTLPWLWVECPADVTCRSIVHVEEPAELLNSYPHEWVLGMLGECEASENSFTWMNQHRLPHADDGPAIMTGSGAFTWCRDGSIHREDGPAEELPGSFERWWVDGKLHREGAPALLEADVEKWYVNGLLHREDGPAMTIEGEFKSWYREGKLHREDGRPAVVYSYGKKEWRENGEIVSPSPIKLVSFMKMTWMKAECLLRRGINRSIRIDLEYKPSWK